LIVATTTVRLRPETRAKLDDLKFHPHETYDEVVGRLADAAYDDEPLSAEEFEQIRQSEEDLEAGRVRSLREIMRDLGDDLALEPRVD
jgi:hypothetical protein